MSENKKYKILEKSDPQNAVVSMSVEIDKEFVASYRKATIEDLKKDIEIDGFRKGNAPEDKVIEKVGELSIWEKNTFKAINTIVPLILQEEKLNVITMPNISITKLAPDTNPEIRIEATLMPEVKLADYKKIAKGVERVKETEATDKELEDYIEYVRKTKATDKDKLPELDDKFVKELGDFKSVDDFKKQLKENLSKDKKMQADQQRRIKIMEQIIKESEIDLPEVLVAEEQERMLHEFKVKVEGFKMNFEEYLKEIKKTEEDLKKEWRADAEKRAKMNLVLPKIAREENLKADEKDVEHEVKHLKEHHPEIDDNVAKVYVTNVLSNQKVFEYLDNLS
jgi:FKBP-type peptidyl-prolyl cis-trans isomerase (trigger factor)